MLDLILEVLGAAMLISQAVWFFFTGETAFDANATAEAFIR